MRVRFGRDQQLHRVSGLGAARHPDAPRRSLTRRAALGLLTAGAAAGPYLIRQARAATPLAVRLDWSPHAMHCGFHLAAESGFFKKAGLDVQVEDGNGSTTTVQVVGAGKFDVGHAALAPMAIAKAAGMPVISVAGFLRTGDMGFLVDRKLKVTKLEDLEGHSIDYTAGSLEGPFVQPFFALNHIPVDKIKLLNVDASAKMSSYVSGAVDGMITSVPSYYVLVADKRPVDMILFADYGLNLPGFGLVTRPEVLKEKGDAVRRLASVLCSTWTYIWNGRQDEAARAFLAQRPNSGMSKQQVLDSLEVYKPFFWSKATKTTPIGVQDAGDWTATIAQMEVAKVVPPGSKPSDYFTNGYIDYSFGNQIVGV